MKAGSAIVLRLERRMDPGHQRRSRQKPAPEKVLAHRDGSLDERLAFRGEHRVALVDARQPQEYGRVQDGQKVVDVELEVGREPVELLATPALGEETEETRESADPGVGQRNQRGACRFASSGVSGRVMSW